MLNQFQSITQTEVLPPRSLPLLALANPPFEECRVSREPMYQHYDVAYHWQLDQSPVVRQSKLQSKVGLEALFVELCVKQCQPGEVAVILVPTGLLSNRSYQYFRDWLTDHMVQVRASIGLPPVMWQVECSIGLNTSFLVLTRKPDCQVNNPDYLIFFGVSEHVGFDSRRRKVYERLEDGSNRLKDDLPELRQHFMQFLIDEQS